MKKTILTDKAIQDFSDLEKEVNALMSIFLKRPFDMREESQYSKYKKMSYMVYILFCNEHMHRYGKQTNTAIAEYFNDYTKWQIKGMHDKAKNDLELNKVFKSLYEMTETVGIKMVTEGWVKSRAMQVQFIDRQINILRDRKKSIQERVDY